MPPPEQVIPDKRRKAGEELARREAEDDLGSAEEEGRRST
jgi:hypothetical protein